MDGLLRCTRYAFGPNRLHYCGPDANQEIFEHYRYGAADAGLLALLKDFKTMFPYLRLIAEANDIRDPFDERVVEAYWIGNELLDRVDIARFYRSLVDDHELKRKFDLKTFEVVAEKLRHAAVPHHSFHVFDIWKRTGNLETEHTLDSLDSCRIGWGRVIEVDGPKIIVETEPVVLENGKLALGKPIRRRLTRGLESLSDIEQLQLGDLVTYHWGVPCETVTEEQVARLRKYTMRHLDLANQTL
ncbi:MAG: DUF6390 family protein [Patescibacteria group bacterium]|nr:DUF6390 family protein [Patescibacteria group bacterium]